MKTRYKHIEFVVGGQQVDADKTWYSCRNIKSGDEMARVYYYPLWKRYVTEFDAGYVFDNSCLADIIHFMKHL